MIFSRKDSYTPERLSKDFGVKVYWDLELGHTKVFSSFKWSVVKTKEKSYKAGSKTVKVKKINGKVRMKISNSPYKIYFYKDGDMKVNL